MRSLMEANITFMMPIPPTKSEMPATPPSESLKATSVLRKSSSVCSFVVSVKSLSPLCVCNKVRSTCSTA